MRLFDTTSGTALLSIENGRKCTYTALQWDALHAELLVGDEANCMQRECAEVAGWRSHVRLEAVIDGLELCAVPESVAARHGSAIAEVAEAAAGMRAGAPSGIEHYGG